MPASDRVGGKRKEGGYGQEGAGKLATEKGKVGKRVFELSLGTRALGRRGGEERGIDI